MALQEITGYELLEVLGEGPCGIVYKARDVRYERPVAVKIFHTFDFADSQKLPLLNHPHLATVFEIGRTGSQWFTVTEYLSGGDLKNHIRSLRSVGDTFPPDQILAYAEDLAGALMYAHAQEVLHGNVKTENIMFSKDGTLKLTDFNPRRDPDFHAGQREDLIGLGNVLYELATGQTPFPGIAVPPVDSFRRDLPPRFTQFVGRMLDAERQDSHDDLRTAVEDLKLICSSAVATRVRLAETLPAAAAPIRPTAPALSPDRLLSGRFRIVRFIARGGMGDVYEAEDVELRERVALKTVRPEIAGVEQAMERFKREIQLARKVTNPNVCRIFDLFHDTVGSEKITFLTMELLNGETLQQRIERTGRIDPKEALPIVQQMAAGLAAAHRAGVIHRDFKSSNVILAPADDAGREFRAVVTDFGLARSSLAGESMALLTNAAGAVGTPAYMAPEQLESGPITAATDIYAFGIVMYQMVAGALPFDGDSALAIALKRLQEPAPSPRTRAPDLDLVWETSILRCLERAPADRFASVDDLVNALTDQIVSVPRVPAPHGRFEKATGRRRFALIGGVLFLAILAGALAIRNKGAAPELKTRRAIAVLSLRNLTGESEAAWLSTALSEMLTTELAAGEKLRAIPEENVARMSAELSLPNSSSFAADTLARFRSYLGADLIVYGSYVLISGTPDKIRVDLRLQDSVQGEVLGAISEEGYAADLLALVSRSGAALREKLGVGKLEPTQAEAARAALPATPEAARYYADGLQKLRLFDAQGARTMLERAVAEDEKHALAHAALATSWSMLGYAMKAREQSKIALDLSARLSREDQLLIEGRFRETALEWHQAVEAYRALFGFFPDNLEYGLRLVAAQTSAGEAKDGLATIEKLRKLPLPDRDSPRIDLAEARAAAALSDFKSAQMIAARAAAKARDAGARLLVAGARLIEGSALANLGDLSLARAAFEDARQMYEEAGDRWDAANASTNLAYVVMQSGDLPAAEKSYQQSLMTYKEVGDRKGTATALASIGTVLRSRGDFSGAKSMHEQALAIQKEIGDRIGEAMSRNNLANLLSLMGDSKAARGMFETALPVFRETGDRNAVATVLSNLGDLVSEEGDLARARELYEESRATFQVLGNKSSLAYELSRLGELELINGDLGEARKRHEEALALRRQVGEKGGVGESQLALAQISLHEGEAAVAEQAAKAAAEEFKAANRPDDEASAMAVLARSYLVREQYAESSDAIKRAEELSIKSSDVSVRLSVAMTGASIRAARGGAEKAMKDLAGVIVEARKAGLVRLEFEAMLALAEVEIASGRYQTGRARLELLQKEAAARGYKYIAGRAAAARKSIPGAAA